MNHFNSYKSKVLLLAATIGLNGFLLMPSEASAWSFWRCRICVGSGGLYNCCETEPCGEGDMCCDYDSNCALN